MPSGSRTPVEIRTEGRTLHVSIAAQPSGGKWLSAAFWNAAWLFGLALFGFLLMRLVDMTLMALVGPVSIGVILLCAATLLLLAWIVFWVAVGIILLYHALFNACGVEAHTITPDAWTIERRIARWRQTATWDMDHTFHVRQASGTRSAGIVFSHGTPTKHRTVAFGSHATNDDLAPLLETLRERHPYLFEETQDDPM